MAETMCRALRDGSLEGEHAPALTIKDTIRTAFGVEVFDHVLCYMASTILAQKSQSSGLVLVALDRSPSLYLNLLKSRGIDASDSYKWIRVLDCYTDPLGWKEGANVLSRRESLETLFKDVSDLDKLFDAVIQLGRGMVGQGKVRFCVAIDSASLMLRHASLSSVGSLINNLRSHDQVSSIFWLIHSDLHEIRATSVLEYMSSMVGSLEPIFQSSNEQRRNSENLLSIENDTREGKFIVRLKRRNGRVKVMCEEFHVEETGIKFLAVPSESEMVNQQILPKLQFNLQLSEKERNEKENVVLPFEHQGNGQTIQIYDGRRSLPLNKNDSTTSVSVLEKLQAESAQGKGEIHYLRDSDDELPDSDEDPDDDLDI
ncbi:hypothetical protein Syun_021797 [Stephania yunnanensis]|uniref:Elongator complex protein 5 n=1 Tax=Stephania yunnanensis TaxID=152371 RepID=A0AAP0NRF2_9MAGN